MRECFSKKIRGVRVYSFEEIRSSVLRSFSEKIAVPASRRGRIERDREIYLGKIEKAYKSLVSMVKTCAEIPTTKEIHPFYSDLISSLVGDVYDNTIISCRRVLTLSRGLYQSYRKKILGVEQTEEMRSSAREFVGRILSLARRKIRGVERLREVLAELSKMPCIEEESVKVVLTGMPQVGKSTFLSMVSRARPEISVYPFTTKKIIAGHYIDETRGVRLMILDTPGLLDRPIEEMNQIELKAVASLRHLADVAIFIIDPRRGFYYTLEQQLRVLDTVRGILGDKRIFMAINKIDIASPEEIEEAEKRLLERGFSERDIFRISAAKNIGLVELLQRVVETTHSGQRDTGSIS